VRGADLPLVAAVGRIQYQPHYTEHGVRSVLNGGIFLAGYPDQGVGRRIVRHLPFISAVIHQIIHYQHPGGAAVGGILDLHLIIRPVDTLRRPGYQSGGADRQRFPSVGRGYRQHGVQIRKPHVLQDRGLLPVGIQYGLILHPAVVNGIGIKEVNLAAGGRDVISRLGSGKNTDRVQQRRADAVGGIQESAEKEFPAGKFCLESGEIVIDLRGLVGLTEPAAHLLPDRPVPPVPVVAVAGNLIPDVGVQRYGIHFLESREIVVVKYAQHRLDDRIGGIIDLHAGGIGGLGKDETHVRLDRRFLIDHYLVHVDGIRRRAYGRLYRQARARYVPGVIGELVSGAKLEDYLTGLSVQRVVRFPGHLVFVPHGEGICGAHGIPGRVAVAGLVVIITVGIDQHVVTGLVIGIVHAGGDLGVGVADADEMPAGLVGRLPGHLGGDIVIRADVGLRLQITVMRDLGHAAAALRGVGKGESPEKAVQRNPAGIVEGAADGGVCAAGN